MKKSFFLLLALFLFRAPLFAQCGSGACPAGADNALPTNGIIAVGTTYCISGPVSNTTAYTIDGTLIIQSGSVTVGDLTVGKTGAIIVNGGGRLMANSYTGDATAPASGISNVTACSFGYLYLSGAINPGETNFTVSDYGIFVIHGSWSTIIGDTWFKLGKGSIVEMCSAFSFKSSTGFFTETSSDPSYIVTRSAMANGAGGGYLSKSGAASQIMWAIPGGPVAWVTHPAANTCTGTSCASVLPPGSNDNGVCGSVANSFQMAVLPLQFIDVEERLSGGDFLITAELGDAVPAERVVLEAAADGVHFTTTGYKAMVDGESSYRFTLPAVAAKNYYRVEAIGNGGDAYSKVLPPVEVPDEGFTSAVVMNCMGQVVRRIRLPVARYELTASLSAGIYIVLLEGPGRTPLTLRIWKAL